MYMHHGPVYWPAAAVRWYIGEVISETAPAIQREEILESGIDTHNSGCTELITAGSSPEFEIPITGVVAGTHLDVCDYVGQLMMHGFAKWILPLGSSTQLT
jgi:hypothetical protein